MRALTATVTTTTGATALAIPADNETGTLTASTKPGTANEDAAARARRWAANVANPRTATTNPRARWKRTGLCPLPRHNEDDAAGTGGTRRKMTNPEAITTAPPRTLTTSRRPSPPNRQWSASCDWSEPSRTWSSYNTCVGLLFRLSFSNQPAPPRGDALPRAGEGFGQMEPFCGLGIYPTPRAALPPPPYYPQPPRAPPPPPYHPAAPALAAGRGGGFAFTDPAQALHGLGPPRPSGFGAIAGGPPGGGDSLAPGARPARAVAITGPRRPASAGIIGPALATMDGVRNQYYNCPICQAPPPGDGILQHRAFECPAVYARTPTTRSPSPDARKGSSLRK